MPKKFLNRREKTVVITLVTLAFTLTHYVRSVSTVMVWVRSIQSVGVSRGYTDYHQGRAIHIADSRIH